MFNTSIFSVPLDSDNLAKLPDTVQAANIKVSITVGDDYALKPKFRRFAVSPSSAIAQNQSVTVVCHRRRMVQINGQPWLGVGFYLAGGFGYNTSQPPTLGEAKQVLHDMHRQGMTQVMPYGIDSLSLQDREEIVDFMDNDLNASMKFDMPLVADVVVILRSTIGSHNFTAAWARLSAKIKSVRHSPSLLGYYICDDCNNADAYPPQAMADLSVAIRAIDPFHIIIGAPWQR